MTKDFENKDRVLMENAYFRNENIDVCGFYGLSNFEIYHNDNFLYLNRKEFLTLYNLMTEMKKEIDRLENLWYNRFIKWKRGVENERPR